MRRLLALLTIALSTSSPTAPTADELLQKNVTTLIDSAKLDQSDNFAKQLLASTEWQRELLDSGPVEQPDKVVQVLHGIWKSDPELVGRPIDRAMATACALEAPRRNQDAAAILPRYQYFRDKWKYGLLNTIYQDLSVFERRYLARGVQHTGLNTIASMEYQNQEVCLPAEKYTGACWYASYQLHNHFGDSIHGPNYYRPYQKSWDSYAETIRKVGGVCGSLSNFGASSAIANGIPAITMGEPGHCAYAVMTQPKHWQPAYSLSWKRGVHSHYYSNSWGWHMLNTRSQQSRKAAHASGDLRRLALHYFSNNNPEGALTTIRKARIGYPLDYLNWQQSVNLLTTAKAPASQWQTLHQDVIKHLAPVSGEVAFHLLTKSIYPRVMPKGEKDVRKRRAVLLAYHKAIGDWGLARWDFNAALQRHLKLLGGTPADQDSFMVAAFTIHAKNNLFTPMVLETQLGKIGGDHSRRQTFIAGIGKALAKSKDADFSKVIDSMAAKVLPDSAKRGDKASFQFIGKLTAKNYPVCDVSPEPFPGILLSSGGTFAIQKPGNRWDNPARHWGVIEEHGGDFHTNAQPATATVQLGNYGRLSGIIIVARNGNFWRMKNIIIQTSANGKDWQDVHKITEAKRVHRIDLTGKTINAGYVRATQPDHKSIHFQKFLIYGKKQN